MNRFQRRILVLFAVVTAAMICFPPWKTVFIGGWYAPGEWSEGRAFLLMPPAPSPNAYQYHSELHVRIDWPLLASLWGITVLLFTSLYLIFRLRSGEERQPSDQIVASRKLLTSVLLALCFPVQPVAYVVAGVFLGGGHLWEAALLFETAVFVILFALSYLTLSVTQWLSRGRHDHETARQV
jgi:hypothetical protein